MLTLREIWLRIWRSPKLLESGIVAVKEWQSPVIDVIGQSVANLFCGETKHTGQRASYGFDYQR